MAYKCGVYTELVNLGTHLPLVSLMALLRVTSSCDHTENNSGSISTSGPWQAFSMFKSVFRKPVFHLGVTCKLAHFSSVASTEEHVQWLKEQLK